MSINMHPSLSQMSLALRFLGACWSLWDLWDCILPLVLAPKCKVVPNLEMNRGGGLPCPALITGSAFLSVRGRREIVELWAHQANLGLLVNLAVRAPQDPRVPHLQVRATLLHLIHAVVLLASLPESTGRCQQRPALCSELENA